MLSPARQATLNTLLVDSLLQLIDPGFIFQMEALPTLSLFNKCQEIRRQYMAALVADAAITDRLDLEQFKTDYSLDIEKIILRLPPEKLQERRETLELHTALFFRLVDELVALARE